MYPYIVVCQIISEISETGSTVIYCGVSVAAQKLVSYSFLAQSNCNVAITSSDRIMFNRFTSSYVPLTQNSLVELIISLD